jgi:hypothetical protein
MGRSYRELIAWQKAMKFVTEIYEATQPFPREECYGLTNQLRRAAVSVPSNIAEGQARFSQKEFHHFLSQARDLSPKLRLNFLSPRACVIFHRLRRTYFYLRPMNSAECSMDSSPR